MEHSTIAQLNIYCFKNKRYVFFLSSCLVALNKCVHHEWDTNINQLSMFTWLSSLVTVTHLLQVTEEMKQQIQALNLSEKLNAIYSGLDSNRIFVLCCSLALAISSVQMSKASWLKSKLKIKRP